MKFEDFIKEGVVRKAYPDKLKIKSIIKFTNDDLKFLNTLNLNELSKRKIVVNYYDSLRIYLEAISLLQGYKIYSHKAFTYFLDEQKEKHLAIKFDRFRKIRNGLNYYGKNISIKESKEIIEDLKEMIKTLKNKYLKEFI